MNRNENGDTSLTKEQRYLEAILPHNIWLDKMATKLNVLKTIP